MQPDTELETWRREWQADAAVPPVLQRKVERELRHARRGTLMAIAVTVVFGVGVPVHALATRTSEDLVLAAGVWAFIALTWIVSLRITRGASKPLASTTNAFLDFSILSCRRHQSEIAAGAVLYMVLLTFIMALQYHSRSDPGLDLWTFLSSGRRLVVWPVTAAVGALAVRRFFGLRQELRNLLRLRSEQLVIGNG